MLKGYDNIKHKRLGNIKIKEPIFPPHPPIGSFYFKWYFYLYYSLQLKNKNVITLVGRSPDFDFFHCSKNQNLGVYDLENWKLI